MWGQASTSRFDAIRETNSPSKLRSSDSEDAMETYFTAPPEAPVFKPTAEEWKDPILYIEKIRPIAECYGICKIIPPEDWHPMFALNVDKFLFTPRIQRLNELEARTRVQLNFLDSIAKFWDLQGSSLRIPLVERKALDLFLLHRLVKNEGGLESIIKERKWAKIAAKMGYAPGRGLGTLLKSHYERILYPLDIFQEGKLAKLTNMHMSNGGKDDGKLDTDYKPHGILSRQAVKPPKEKYSRRSKRFERPSTPDEERMDSELAVAVDPGGLAAAAKVPKKHAELKRLEFYGAAPKPKGAKLAKGPAPEEAATSYRSEDDPLAKYVCLHCRRGDSEASMLLCDGCDDSYHTFCLMPPMPDIPKGEWRCPNCIAKEVSKPLEAFGFEQAKRKYTLKEFGEMADTFKTHYFNKPVDMVPCDLVEREFWRVVSNITEDVSVQYGADLHTMEHGSGFPTRAGGGDPAYAESPWNLNNLPVVDSSVLGHINADISGMKVPWMYVGMCFAAFCWHNEDHWSYSINYLHWGEPKTWYGVPGGKAEAFEASMRKAAPELFQAQPDLLHQLVTIMNPNALMEDGIPVCRTDQRAGEFVVTFPRAYHAGFNQGYNFAEAVNFAPADWLPLGRASIDHYSAMRRVCVFSHDELVCNMAMHAQGLHVTVARAAYQDMLQMVDGELASRKTLLNWGVAKAEREEFELLPDDERQCEECKTTCFLSAVTCACAGSRLVCLRHFDKLCACPPADHTLRYRYTLDELPDLLGRLKDKAESFEKWCDAVKSALGDSGAKLLLEELKALLQEATEQKFPACEPLEDLNQAVLSGDLCTSMAQKLMVTKVRTRNRPSSASRFLLTVEELKRYHDDLLGQPFTIKEAPQVRVLVEQVEAFELHAQELLNQPEPQSQALEQALEQAATIDIKLPDVVPLKHALTQARWLESLAVILEEFETLSLEEMKRQLDIGVNLPPSPLIEQKMFGIQELISQVEHFEDRAKTILVPKYRQPLNIVVELVQIGEAIPAFLPSLDELREAKEKSLQWIQEATAMRDGDMFPYMDQLEAMVNAGRAIPVRLDTLPALESELQAGKLWRERTARTFLRKNSSYSLMEALSPRAGLEIANSNAGGGGGGKTRRHRPPSPPLRAPLPTHAVLNGNVDPVHVVDAFRVAEDHEAIAMMRLRKDNAEKYGRRTPDTPFCLCRSPLEGYMLMCALCRDWFHGSCVPTPKSGPATPAHRPPGTPGLPQSNLTTRDMRYLCPRCLRSRRPRLETILSLLVTLQKLSVRVPEGEALQCLTERAMNWQDRARNILATAECTTALAQLSVHSQRLVEAAAREKTEKIINSELLKAASNPHLTPRIKGAAAPQQQSPGPSTVNEDSTGSPSGHATPEHPAPGFCYADPSSPYESAGFGLLVPPHYDMGASTSNSSTATSPSVLEHTYSSVSKVTPPAASSTPAAPAERSRHVRKTPHVPRQMDPPPLAISPHTHQTLELLMFEGDMLEVSLDELQLIYKIMHAANPKAPALEEFDCGSDVGGKSDTEMEMLERSSTVKKRPMGDVAGHNTAKRVKKITPKPSKGKKKLVPKELSTTKVKRAVPKGGPAPDRARASTSQQADIPDDSCAAECCVHPAGKVDWVQCDARCQLWFHLRCVGLMKEEVAGDKEYHCKRCKLDESMGLDALLSLANSCLDVTPPAATTAYGEATEYHLKLELPPSD